MPTVTEWTLAIISNVIHFGFVIAILYTLKRFYKHRYSQPLQKRSPLLVYLMNICFLFYLLNHITYKIAYIHGETDRNIDPMLEGEEVRHQHIMELISIICYIFSVHGMLIMCIARSWVIYFNCHYGLELQKSEWCVHLNDHYSDTLWFVKHRKDYGSNRVIYPVTITWYIIDTLIQTFLLFQYSDIRMIYDLASWLIKLILLIIIWNKIPSFNDIFGIKKEMQWMFRAAGISLLLWIGYLVYVMMLGYNLWIFMIAQFIFGVMIGIMALILNGFIFHHSDYKHLISTTLGTRTIRGLSCSSFIAISKGETLSLLQVLENEELIQRLFEYLANEFSVELLSALIEFKQFHDLMESDEEFMGRIREMISANSGDTRISQNILETIQLAHELPKSSIVHENHCQDEEDIDHIRMYLEIARDLFNKYVSTRADFQVNLSYRYRREISSFIQERNDPSSVDALNQSEQLELFILFNRASNELYHLLDASHSRYIRDKKYYPTSNPNNV